MRRRSSHYISLQHINGLNLGSGIVNVDWMHTPRTRKALHPQAILALMHPTPRVATRCGVRCSSPVSRWASRFFESRHEAMSRHRRRGLGYMYGVLHNSETCHGWESFQSIVLSILNIHSLLKELANIRHLESEKTLRRILSLDVNLLSTPSQF
jgi:hypothetical protein